jgi:hypothetical protein
LEAAAIGALFVGMVVGQQLPEPYGPLVAYGPLGVFVLLYLTGWIPSRAELQRQIERAERAEDQRDALTEKAAAETIPLLGEVQRTMLPTLERMATAVERMGERMERLAERVERIERSKGP